MINSGFLFSLTIYNIETWTELPLNDRKSQIKFLVNAVICFDLALAIFLEMINNVWIMFAVAVYMFVLTRYQKYKYYMFYSDCEIVEVTHEEKPKGKKGKKNDNK